MNILYIVCIGILLTLVFFYRNELKNAEKSVNDIEKDVRKTKEYKKLAFDYRILKESYNIHENYIKKIKDSEAERRTIDYFKSEQLDRLIEYKQKTEKIIDCRNNFEYVFLSDSLCNVKVLNKKILNKAKKNYKKIITKAAAKLNDPKEFPSELFEIRNRHSFMTNMTLAQILSYCHKNKEFAINEIAKSLLYDLCIKQGLAEWDL